MSSYLGTQAQAVGVGRYYGGLLGRADRLVLILVVGVVDLLFPMNWYVLGFSLSWFGWLFILFGIFGHITAFQRFAYVWAKVE
jgi:archaetidylinositol phosphate synthase